MRSALPHPTNVSIANARSSGSRELQSAAEPISAPARKSSARPASDSSPALSRAKATGGSRPRSTEKLSAGRSAEARSPGLGRSRRLRPSATAAVEAKTAASSIGVKISGASPKRSKPLSPKPIAKAAYQSVNMSGRRITSSQGVRMAERPRSRLAASSPVCQVCPITTRSSAVSRPPNAAEQSCSVRWMYLQQTVGRKLSSAAPPKIVSRSVSDQAVQFAAANASSAPESRRIAQLPMIIPKGRSDRAWSKSAAGGALSSSAVFFSAFAAASGAGSAETVGVSAGAGAIGLVSAVLVLRSTAVSGGGVAAPRTKFGALEGAMLGAAPETASTPSVRSVSGEGAIAERSSAFSSSEGSPAGVSAGRSAAAVTAAGFASVCADASDVRHSLGADASGSSKAPWSVGAAASALKASATAEDIGAS